MKEISRIHDPNPIETNEYDRLFNWLKRNGAYWTGIEFPAFNESGTRGIAASRDIQPSEVIMCIPHSLIVAPKTLRETFFQKPFLKFPSLLCDSEPGDCMVLHCFLSMEKAKGPESFYWPLFSMTPSHGSPLSWEEDFIHSKISCQYVREEILNYRLEVERDFKIAQQIFKEFPELFGKITKEDFVWAYEYTMTRSFGWKNVGSILIPLAEFINHHYRNNVMATMVSVSLEENPSANPLYFSKNERFDFDFLLKELGVPSVSCKKHSPEPLMRKEYIQKRLSLLSPESKSRFECSEYSPEQEKVFLYEVYSEEIQRENKDILNDFPYLESSDEENNDSQDEKSEDSNEEQEYVNVSPNPKPAAGGNEESWEEEEERKEEKPKRVSKEKREKMKAEERRVELLREEILKREAEKKMAERLNGKLKESGSVKVECAIKENEGKSEGEVKKEGNEDSIGSIIERGIKEEKITEDRFVWWFDGKDDSKKYVIIANISNAVIPKGTQLHLAYGNRTNDYLFSFYGFTLPGNIYDSIHFHVNRLISLRLIHSSRT